MRKIAIAIAAALSLCLVSLATPASADTLIMRDGSRVQGSIVGIKGRTITFRHLDGVTRRYFTSQVEGLQFDSAERVNPRAVNGLRLEAPAGSRLVVRTTEAIDSRTAAPDQLFSAVVNEPTADASGRVIVPAGSSAQLMIRQVSAGGDRDRPEIGLHIQSITINGRRYLVSMTDATVTAGGQAAVVGVVVGTAAEQALTRGRDVKVPAETAITFRLDKLVTLQAAP